MVHLTADGVVTTCGHPVGELAADTYTTDPDLADCFDCESLQGHPRTRRRSPRLCPGLCRWPGQELPGTGRLAACRPCPWLRVPALHGCPGHR